ncbi:hypothetical protein [Pontibacter flavimaris]|jgi:hypothetical protein|uniref:Uncharacterized protein n=1 Tax=Pontibacter flavimaris TaxID=1797110 RepID=A0A1Q5PG80_9BACT|nr:hypothetical protein [Pontibacter flavimaris]OKL41227.1 hypothetical protein A3841_15545 [Pontibacter flavimaris]
MSIKNENKKNLDELKKNNPNQEDQSKLMGNIDDNPVRNKLNKDATKVQNPNRNLAKGGNNTPYDKK